MIRLMFVISSLNRGGAERQLTLLTKSIDRTRFAVSIVTIYDGGAFRPELASIDGVQVFSLHKKSRWDIPIAVWRFVKILRQVRPQIVHGYLDVANVLALSVAKPMGAKIVMGLRSSTVEFSQYGRLPALYFRSAAGLSRFADLIVANSCAGKRHLSTWGFCAERMVVIPNGFDTDTFRPDPEAGRQKRREWGVADDECLIGLVARLDPIKDHPTFLRAAAQMSQDRPNVRFVCVGDGESSYRQRLHALADGLGLQSRLVWAGEQEDMIAVHNALDVATSTSISEGFSNTVAEAMACGVSCVVTDVGDSAVIVGSSGLVVPVGDVDALQAAWAQLLDLPRERRCELARAARERIVNEYSLEALARKTEAVLASLAPTQ
jgi:glycosyltransferase involved in cell wall biosynthesis